MQERQQPCKGDNHSCKLGHVREKAGMAHGRQTRTWAVHELGSTIKPSLACLFWTLEMGFNRVVGQLLSGLHIGLGFGLKMGQWWACKNGLQWADMGPTKMGLIGPYAH